MPGIPHPPDSCCVKALQPQLLHQLHTLPGPQGGLHAGSTTLPVEAGEGAAGEVAAACAVPQAVQQAAQLLTWMLIWTHTCRVRSLSWSLQCLLYQVAVQGDLIGDLVAVTAVLKHWT